MWLTIVGVSGDVRQYGLANPPIDQIYLSMLQYPGPLDGVPRAHAVGAAAR